MESEEPEIKSKQASKRDRTLKEHIASHDSHYGEMKRELFPNYCHLHYLHNVRQ